MANVFSKCENTTNLLVEIEKGRFLTLEQVLQELSKAKNESERLKKDYANLEKLYDELREEKLAAQLFDEKNGEVLMPGKWFRISLDEILDKKLYIETECLKCGKAGEKIKDWIFGSIDLALKNKMKYFPFCPVIETFFIEKTWENKKSSKELREMCFGELDGKKGDGQVNEVIAGLEIGQRICNGESAKELIEEPDRFRELREITLLNGKTGILGGGCRRVPAADLFKNGWLPLEKCVSCTTSAFRYKR